MINKKYERLKKYIKEKYGQKCYFCKNSNINSLQVRHIIPNKQFLSTPYWTAIAAKKKIKAHYCCELCNSQKLLNVHHKTYEHHGYELDNMNDLIVLCSDCHKKFHNIIKED